MSKQTSLMLQLVACFFVLTVSAGSAMAASKIAYVCNSNGTSDHEVCLMNPDGSDSTVLTNFQGLPSIIQSLAWSSDGLRIAVGGFEGTFLMDIDGGNLVQISPAFPSDQAGLNRIAWSPELPASVASISPFGQFVIVFMLGGASALWMTRRQQAASPLTTT